MFDLELAEHNSLTVVYFPIGYSQKKGNFLNSQAITRCNLTYLVSHECLFWANSSKTG